MNGSSPTTRRRWRRLAIGFAIGFGALVALAPPYGLRRDRDTFQCSACLSKRHVFQWKVGEWTSPSLPLSPKTSVVEESRTYRCFTAQPHVHEWHYFQGSPYYWFGTSSGGCALGANRHRNDLAEAMEHPWPDFVEFVDSQLKSGVLTTNQIYEALVSPRTWTGATNQPTAGQLLARKLVDDFFDQESAPTTDR